MTAVVSVPAAEVIGHRYAARRKEAQHVGHLLTRTWEKAPGRGRPALCGVVAQNWRAVDSFARPESFHDCADCSRLAGIVPPPPTRIAPPPRPRVGRTVDLHALSAGSAASSQAERVARRVGFRDRIAHGTADERPQPAPSRSPLLRNPDPKH